MCAKDTFVLSTVLSCVSIKYLRHIFGSGAKSTFPRKMCGGYWISVSSLRIGLPRTLKTTSGFNKRWRTGSLVAAPRNSARSGSLFVVFNVQKPTAKVSHPPKLIWGRFFCDRSSEGIQWRSYLEGTTCLDPQHERLPLTSPHFAISSNWLAHFWTSVNRSWRVNTVRILPLFS